jgi:hypothetical protein
MVLDKYWFDMVEREGIRVGLNLVLDRIELFKANNEEPKREGWAHLDQTMKLIEVCSNAAPLRHRRKNRG